MWQLNKFVIYVFKELHNSAAAYYRSHCSLCTKAHIFWRDASKCFPLYCLFASPTFSFQFSSSILQATADGWSKSFTSTKAHLQGLKIPAILKERPGGTHQGAMLTFSKASSTLHRLECPATPWGTGLWKPQATQKPNSENSGLRLLTYLKSPVS